MNIDQQMQNMCIRQYHVQISVLQNMELYKKKLSSYMSKLRSMHIHQSQLQCCLLVIWFLSANFSKIHNTKGKQGLMPTYNCTFYLPAHQPKAALRIACLISYIGKFCENRILLPEDILYSDFMHTAALNKEETLYHLCKVIHMDQRM